MKASKDPKDLERYDTLCDVNMSFTAAVDILNDLLCYEKLESGILSLHREDVLITSFLSDCVLMFSAQARECGVTMTVITDVTEDNLSPYSSLQQHDSIFVDKFKMVQVIRNLISNALKFTPRGGTMTIEAKFLQGMDEINDLAFSNSVSTAKPSWSTSSVGMGYRFRRKTHHTTGAINVECKSQTDGAESTDGYLVVVVTDSGAGISAENQKRLFKDIVQFSPEKLQAGGGSGLGLWITGGIVELHGGDISVFSEGEGTGCSFTVKIPMIRSHAHNQQQQLEHHAVSIYGGKGSCESALLISPDSLPTSFPASLLHPSPFRRGKVLHVLVVDDSRLNRKMLLKCLRTDGHRCTEAEDGLQAIERVKERMDLSNESYGKTFDVILMDFIMPNMDGPTATKEIRSMNYLGAIFGVTGNGEIRGDNLMFL